MSELELVWIRECEICGREHQQCETHDIRSVDEIEAESKAFKQRCEDWYSAHIRVLLEGQPAASTPLTD
tara:strand:+ start:181 stop:387 length:207 start_codon:yes stop_codon:yes gene_type:complete